jgi:hypothetical protein
LRDVLDESEKTDPIRSGQLSRLVPDLLLVPPLAKERLAGDDEIGVDSLLEKAGGRLNEDVLAFPWSKAANQPHPNRPSAMRTIRLEAGCVDADGYDAHSTVR